MGSRKHKEELLSLVSVLVTSSFLKPLLATRIPSEERKKRRKRNESTLPPFPQFLGFPPQTTLTLKITATSVLAGTKNSKAFC
jgi:hypothetical protein